MKHSAGDGKAFFGKLNLIIVTSEGDYDLWLQGTRELQSKAPVTRDDAKAHFASLGLTKQVSGGE